MKYITYFQLNFFSLVNKYFCGTCLMDRLPLLHLVATQPPSSVPSPAWPSWHGPARHCAW